jgi:hypothetical protein
LRYTLAERCRCPNGCEHEESLALLRSQSREKVVHLFRARLADEDRDVALLNDLSLQLFGHVKCFDFAELEQEPTTRISRNAFGYWLGVAGGAWEYASAC